jgi:hypothetical protein
MPRRRRLVATDRGETDPLPGEGLLGGVHYVDMLGEEDHLARAPRELRRVIGGHARLCLADAPHHAEHVLAGRVLHRLAAVRGLDRLEQELSGRGFLRVHRGFLVNLGRVREIEHGFLL